MGKKKKILYIVTKSEWGGAQTHVFDLATGFKKKYDVLVAAGRDGDGSLSERLKDTGVKNVKLENLRRAINPLIDLPGLFEIRRLIKKERPDILHLHSAKAGFLGSLAALFLKIKVIYTSHGAAFSASFSKRAKKLFLTLEKLSEPLKHKIICVSHAEQKIWLTAGAAPEDKLVVIENGVNLKLFENILPKDQAREKLAGLNPAFFRALAGQQPDLKIIGTVANFYPDKGLEFLIEAANIVINQKRTPNVIFTVIGDGPLHGLLAEMIEEHHLENKFLLLGRLPDAYQYMQAFDVYVQPSLKEGFGYTALEALAAGLPVVATYVGGMPEMIKNEENGFLVLPRNFQTLADRISLLLKDPSLNTKFIKNSEQKIQDFTLEKMLEKTEKVYLE